jgi:hypothetical protein
MCDIIKEFKFMFRKNTTKNFEKLYYEHYRTISLAIFPVLIALIIATLTLISNPNILSEDKKFIRTIIYASSIIFIILFLLSVSVCIRYYKKLRARYK